MRRSTRLTSCVGLSADATESSGCGRTGRRIRRSRRVLRTEVRYASPSRRLHPPRPPSPALRRPEGICFSNPSNPGRARSLARARSYSNLNARLFTAFCCACKGNPLNSVAGADKIARLPRPAARFLSVFVRVGCVPCSAFYLIEHHIERAFYLARAIGQGKKRSESFWRAILGGKPVAQKREKRVQQHNLCKCIVVGRSQPVFVDFDGAAMFQERCGVFHVAFAKRRMGVKLDGSVVGHQVIVRFA